MAVKVYDDRELALIREILDSGKLGATPGKYVPMFERAFAEAMGARHAVAMNSAMSLLHAAVSAAGAGPGDEVICDPIVQFGGIAAMYNNAVPAFPPGTGGRPPRTTTGCTKGSGGCRTRRSGPWPGAWPGTTG